MARGVSTVTVSVACQQCGRTFDAQRSTARFCSNRCKVRSHRIEAEQRAREEEQRRREAATARAIKAHHDKWVEWLTSNPRVTPKKAEEMYHDGIKRKLIPAPYTQRELWHR